MSTYTPVTEIAERIFGNSKFTLDARQILNTALGQGDVQVIIKCNDTIIDSLTTLGAPSPIDSKWAQDNLCDWLERESDKRDQAIAARRQEPEPAQREIINQLIQSKLKDGDYLRQSSLWSIGGARRILASAEEYAHEGTRQQWNTHILSLIEEAQTHLAKATTYINEAAHHERMADELEAFFLSRPGSGQNDSRVVSQTRIKGDDYVDFTAQFLTEPEQGKYVFSPVAMPNLRIELSRCFTDAEPDDNTFGILNFPGDINICPGVWAVRLSPPTAKAFGLL